MASQARAVWYSWQTTPAFRSITSWLRPWLHSCSTQRLLTRPGWLYIVGWEYTHTHTHVKHTHTHTHTHMVYKHEWYNDCVTLTDWRSHLRTSAPHRSGSESSLIGEKKNRTRCRRTRLSIYPCRATYTPMVYEKACDNDFGGLGATRARLAPAVLHRSESESSSIRGKLWSCYYEKPPLLSLCLCWQIHDNDVYQGVWRWLWDSRVY